MGRHFRAATQNWDPLRAANIFVRKGMDHKCGFGYSSLFSDPSDLQHGAKENYCNFASERISDFFRFLIYSATDMLFFFSLFT